MIRNFQHIKRWTLILAIPFLFALFQGCEKEDKPDIIEEEPTVNEEFEAFYVGLKEWYYWTDQIPDINPSTYPSLGHILEAIKYEPLDRWSFVTEWDEFWAYINDSEYIGYGFGYKYDASENLRISYIFNSVDMYDQGVRRSWIIKAINGTPINPGTNLATLVGPDNVGVSNTFRFIKPGGDEVEITVAKESIVMNTVLHYDVLELEGKKIGYMVLQSFTGTTADELKEVFAYFSQEQIDDLILDMRYNGGGLTSVAQQLASLIGGVEIEGQTFTKYSFNVHKQSEYNKTEPFLPEENSLSLNRLVAIATKGTASSSELVINALRPYMDVTIVGTNTYGKPMGANVLRFNEDWALVPITFKTKNANDEGDYFDGLAVNIPANDGLDRMFGDPEESSLQQALAFLLMGSTKGEALIHQSPWPAFDEKGVIKTMVRVD